MMSRNLLVLALMVPLVAEAQRGGGSSGAPPVQTVRKNPRGDQPNYRGLGPGTGAFTISNKDVESLSPVKLLLDKKKDLALTEEQLKQLKALEAELKVENDTLFDTVDSLRKQLRTNPNASNPQVEQMRVNGVRSAMVEAIKAIRENFGKAEPACVAVLDETQQKTASELLDKHSEETSEMLQEKLGGGKRGR
jgi:hypothetical protein